MTSEMIVNGSGLIRISTIASVALCLAMGARALSQTTSASSGTAIPALDPPGRSVEVHITHKKGFSFPTYREGNLIVRKTGADEAEDNITLQQPPSGDPVHLSLRSKEGSSTILTAVALASDSTVLASGYAVQGAKARYFVALSDKKASSVHFLPTHAYLASEICPNQDGSFWTIGSRPHRLDGSYFGALRRYDRQGKVLDQSIRVQNVGQEFSLASIDPRQVYLSCAGEDAYVYDGIVKQLFHYNVATKHLDQWQVAGPVNFSSPTATGFAVSAKGEVFLSLKQGQHGNLGRRGLFQLVGTSSKNAEWRSVPDTLNEGGKPGEFWLLLGVEDEKLITVRTPISGHLETINWSQIR